MPDPTVESLENARSYLPNVYTDIAAREIDFVTRFGQNWDALREILGIMRPVRKAPGTTLVSYTASVELADGDVNPGNVIPYSAATVTKTYSEDLSLLKYAKAVQIEDVTQYGAVIAVQKTDDAFLNELQSVVMDNFYTFLTGNQSALAPETDPLTFQMAVSMAIGLVRDKFKKIHRTISDVVVFVNTMDVYTYLGAADISVQSAFGLDYVKNFLGASTVVLSSEIDPGTVIAVPTDNIILYYIDPGDGEFAQLGLNYTVSGETNLIGFHANGNYSTAVGESFALMGMALWMEYVDGEAIVTFGNSSESEP